MILAPRCLSNRTLESNELKEDKKNSKKFGPCAVGEKAVYLNSFYIERMYYIPLESVKRIYKRIAMSKGGFSGKGIFATIPYLVVEYDNGEEKQCNFKIEENVDSMLAYVRKNHPEIKTHSEEAEKRLREKEEGKSVIKQYYEIAPKIVSAINERLDSKKIYELLYEQMVKPCVELIEQEKYQETLELYYNVTNQFKKYIVDED